MTENAAIILSSDDFGKNETTNANTLKLLRQKKLDRISIMPNGRFSQEEISEILQSGAKLDIHLTVFDLLDNHIEPGKHIAKRILLFLFDLLKRIFTGKKLALEWQAQIEKFKLLFGQYPDGLNSHEYIHLFPPYFKTVLRLSEKFNIPHIRFGKIIPQKTFVAHALKLLTNFNSLCFQKHRAQTADFLIGLDWIEDIEHFLKNAPAGTTEIVCHPELKEEFEKIEKYF